VRVVKHKLWEGRVHEHRVGWARGVHEDDRTPPAELCPDGEEGRGPEIVVAGSVAREEDDAVRSKCIERVIYLREASGGVEEGGEGREETVA